MNRARSIGLLAAGLILFAALLFQWRPGRPPHPEPAAESLSEGAHAEESDSHSAEFPTTVAAQWGRLLRPVEVTGVLQFIPNAEVRISPQLSGRLSELRVKPGDAVRAGQVLARIDVQDLEAELHRAGLAELGAAEDVNALEFELQAQREGLGRSRATSRAALQGAEARLARLRAGSRPEEVEKAAAAVVVQEQELGVLLAGRRPEEIAQAKAAVADAQAEFAARRADSERKVALFERGIVAGKDRDRAVADFQQAQARLESVRQAEALARLGTRPEEIRAAEARVREARSALDLVRAGARREEILEAEAAVRESRAKLDELDSEQKKIEASFSRVRAGRLRKQEAQAARSIGRIQVGRSLLRAPFEGVVVDVGSSVGEQVGPQTVCVTLAKPGALRAVLQVPGGDVRWFRLGTPVWLRNPDSAGDRLLAPVSVVSPRSDSTGVVGAEVRLTRIPPGWRSGMGVHAASTLSHAPPAVLIPLSCLYERDGDRYVYRVRDGKIGSVRVELIAEDGTTAAVSSGIAVGDRIVVDGSLSIAEEESAGDAEGDKEPHP